MEQFTLNREKDLENERQYDISEIARKSGLMINIFVTDSIWKNMIVPDDEAVKRGEDENSRTKEILSQLVSSIRIARQHGKTNTITFKTRLTSEGKSKDYEITSYLGHTSREDLNPCITLLTSRDLDQ